MDFSPPPRTGRLTPRLALAAAAISAVFLAAIAVCILPGVRENGRAAMAVSLSEAANGALGVAEAYSRLERQGKLSRELAQSEALEGLRDLDRRLGKAVYLWAAGPEGVLLEPDEPPRGAQPLHADDAPPPAADPVSTLTMNAPRGYQPDLALWPAQADSRSGAGAYVAAFEPWGWVIAATPAPDGAAEAENALRDKILLSTLAALAVAAGIFLFATRIAMRADCELARARHDRAAIAMALEESEHKYRDLFANAPLGIYQTTRDGRFLSANAELARIYGYASARELMADVTSTPEQLYVDPADRRRQMELLDASGRVDNFECRVRRKDGAVIWTSRNVRAAFDSSGRHLYNEGFLRDVTARVASEQAMREARDKAQAASLMKTRFLSLITHETLTPITSILGFAKLAGKKIDTDAPPGIPQEDPAARKRIARTLEYLRVIEGESERLEAIIKSALTLADLESGAAQWTIAPCPAARLVKEAAERAAPFFSETGAALRLEISPEAPRARCDREKIVDALTRLLANAAKFAPQGTAVLGAREDKGGLALYVADEGPGIPPESREAVFGIFDQAGDHLTDKPAGVGLGIPIARAIAEGHGGALRLESEPGRGSVFTLLLPAAPIAPVSSTEAEDASA